MRGDIVLLNIYGSVLCPDCVQCVEACKQAGMSFTFHDFGEDLSALKTFLKIRESSPLFDQVRENGQIGIPCLVWEDGHVTLDWKAVM